ncbi:hypothetical protein GRZ55_11145 [Chelativorans sp. ZYF759]|uniref:hypothetical protein n=1 Tax=Chelativorans sp. ZYF759 TaxID=2692213 RepID=UPI00145E3B64|nr:hypothetical protein [Chelativorans sp. ZYF759]NMG39799.1 hypothetical protein [Chelativorans sp. ZYF759]
MATKPYNEKKTYSVKLSRAVQHGRMRFLPGGVYEMKGAFLNKLVDEHGENCVDTADAIA